jgi:hypothetical protein
MKKEKEDITIKKLRKRSRFSKPTVIKAVKKLKRRTSFKIIWQKKESRKMNRQITDAQGK